MEKKFNVGDRVYTRTHAVYQNTQESLTSLIGVVVNNEDYPYNIHVKLDNKPTWGPVGFSEFELTKLLNIPVGTQVDWKFGLVTRQVEKLDENSYAIHDTSDGWLTAYIDQKTLDALLAGELTTFDLNWE